jgi:hypothetical protein
LGEIKALPPLVGEGFACTSKKWRQRPLSYRHCRPNLVVSLSVHVTVLPTTRVSPHAWRFHKGEAPMAARDGEVRPKLGRIRDRKGRKTISYINRVLRTA